MRADRLLKILIYLLNHDTATARQLSVYMEVSLRTIQRDMDYLYAAGVPIQATLGNGGGYVLFPDLKKKNQYIKKKDIHHLVSLLKNLDLGHNAKELEEILNQSMVSSSRKTPTVYCSFGVSSEAALIEKNNSLLKDSIEREVEVAFSYPTQEGTSLKCVQPLALRYQWYAWYLFGFDKEEQVYCSFRVNRIQSLSVTKCAFFRGEDLEELLEKEDQRFLQSCIPVSVWCHMDKSSVVEESFYVEEKNTLPDGHCEMLLRIPEDDRLWMGLMLSLCDGIRILAPDSFREQLREMARQALSACEALALK